MLMVAISHQSRTSLTMTTTVTPVCLDFFKTPSNGTGQSAQMEPPPLAPALTHKNIYRMSLTQLQSICTQASIEFTVEETKSDLFDKLDNMLIARDNPYSAASRMESGMDAKFAEQTQLFKSLFDSHQATITQVVAQVKAQVAPVLEQQVVMQEKIKQLEERLESSQRCSTSQADTTVQAVNPERGWALQSSPSGRTRLFENLQTARCKMQEQDVADTEARKKRSCLLYSATLNMLLVRPQRVSRKRWMLSCQRHWKPLWYLLASSGFKRRMLHREVL